MKEFWFQLSSNDELCKKQIEILRPLLEDYGCYTSEFNFYNIGYDDYNRAICISKSKYPYGYLHNINVSTKEKYSKITIEEVIEELSKKETKIKEDNYYLFIEKYLRGEAERRGYKEGQHIQSLRGMGECVIAHSDYYYEREKDELWLGGSCIRKKGDWAKIIKNEFKINGIDELLIEKTYIIADGERFSKGIIEAVYGLPYFFEISFKKCDETLVILNKKDIEKLLKRMNK